MSVTGFGRDADFILGDNGEIYRIVLPAGGYATFNYDVFGDVRIVTRVVVYRDYDLGIGTGGIGAGDIIFGEDGNDSIYGLVGNDVLFGDAQDDDLIGGSGNDVLFGGTGDDGILGDDGIIYTSRNGTPEPLSGLNTANDQILIAMPGPRTGAVVFIADRLNKYVDLIGPTVGGNDLIFGGLGDGGFGLISLDSVAWFDYLRISADADSLWLDVDDSGSRQHAFSL